MQERMERQTTAKVIKPFDPRLEVQKQAWWRAGCKDPRWTDQQLQMP